MSVNETVGNSAALREALIIAKKAICNYAKHICDSLSWENSTINANCGDILCVHRDLCKAKTEIQKALAKPCRNCDRFATAEEAHCAFCSEPCETPCGNCTVTNVSMPHECFIKWLFAPATEKKGEPYGSK